MPTLGEITQTLHEWYPPATAASWDAVGLVSGDPADDVEKVMFAVDPVLPVAQEAVEWGADLLVVHHPLFLKGVHGVAATTAKGRTLTTLLRGGCALLAAHTNADQALDGVSQAMADAFGLADQAPLAPAEPDALDKLTTYVPAAAAAAVRAALAEAGAGRIGDYDRASFSSPGEGRFRPLEGARPAIGSVGETEVVQEIRIEVVLARARRTAVVRALLAAHPYEEPAYDVVELAPTVASSVGHGRIGTVAPTTLAQFAEAVQRALPQTAGGVRVAGDGDRTVTRVALCGGAGDGFLDLVARTDADVYVTSDLRHHLAGEFLESTGKALVDVAHWAAEWTWLPVVARKLGGAHRVETRVSTIATDPWTLRI